MKRRAVMPEIILFRRLPFCYVSDNPLGVFCGVAKAGFWYIQCYVGQIKYADVVKTAQAIHRQAATPRRQYR